MSALDDRAGIQDIRTAKEHQGNRYEEGGFIDRGEEFLQVEAHRVIAGNQLDASTQAGLLVKEILHRREFEVGHYDFVPWTAKIEARGDNRLGQRHILVERNLARFCAD